MSQIIHSLVSIKLQNITERNWRTPKEMERYNINDWQIHIG